MKLTINRTRKNNLLSNSGFIIADFLFSFVLVIGIGIVIFGLTFSLATIEIAQYIVWSSARNYVAANDSEALSVTSATLKFNNLSKQFPLLTGQGNTGSSWFLLNNFIVGDLAVKDQEFIGKMGSDITNISNGEMRQPWTGASAKITLKLFAGLRIPFLGKITNDPDKFSFPVRAFIIRSPSTKNCQTFFEKRFKEGISQIDRFNLIQNTANVAAPPNQGAVDQAYGKGQEDNGC